MVFLEYVGMVLRMYGYADEAAFNLSIALNDNAVRYGYLLDDYMERIAGYEQYHPLWRQAALGLLRTLIGFKGAQ